MPLADQPDAVRPAQEVKSNGSEELPATAPPINGFHDSTLLSSDPTRRNHNGTGSAPGQQLLNQGPACRANRGSSSSIPYIDCSDIDSECDVTKSSRAPRGHSNANDSTEDESYGCEGNAGCSGGRAGSLFGAVNGFYHTNHQGVMRQGTRSLLDKEANKFSTSHKPVSDDILSNGGAPHGRFQLHSTLLDEIFQGREKRDIAIGRPFGTGTRSQCSSPVISSFHQRTSSLSHAEVTNSPSHACSAPRWDDGGHFFSKRPGAVHVETPTVPSPSHPLNHYGSYSPIISNRTPPHFTKPYNNNNMRNRSDTDPFILSQLTSTPIHHNDPYCPGMQTQAPCSTPTECKTIIANGNHGNLVSAGQPRSSTVQRLFGHQGKPSKNLNQPVQMIDGSTSSGTDTSDTESDTGSSSYSQPLTYGNPAAVTSFSSGNSNGANVSSSLLRSKLSFGSLQLENDGEGEEPQACYRFNEEDIEGVFSC